MKSAILLAMFAGVMVVPSFDVAAQTRRRRTTATTQQQQRRRATLGKTSRAQRDSTEVTLARAQVADQIKTLTRFLYIYGRLSKDLEVSEAQARTSGGAAEAARFTTPARQRLQSSLQDVRAGLDKLELYFRTTPELERYYARLMGVAAAAADAEDRGADNKLDEAGRTLLKVVEQLTDVLFEMS